MATHARTRAHRRADAPTERIERVQPAWKITRGHLWVLALIMAALVVATVEPIRNLFLLGGVLALSIVAEALGWIGDRAAWIGENAILPVWEQVISWF